MSVIPKVDGPDEDRGDVITSMLWTFTGTSAILQILRLYCRLKLRKLGWDDYWMFFTTLLLAAFSIVVHITMCNGGGRHLYYLVQEAPERVSYVAKLSWISQPFGVMALGTGKISVALMILRFLAPSQRWLRYSIWFCVVTVNLALATAMFLSFLQCSPPRKLWEPALEGKCWPPTLQTNFSLFAASYSAVADLYLALVPLRIIWQLQLAARKKIGLCIIFSLGIASGICGFYKTSKIPGIASHLDITWDSYEALLFTGAEIWLIIVCGSVPAIKPLFDSWGIGLRSIKSSYNLSKSARKMGSSEHDDTVELKAVSNSDLRIQTPAPTQEKFRRFSIRRDSDHDLPRYIAHAGKPVDAEVAPSMV